MFSPRRLALPVSLFLGGATLMGALSAPAFSAPARKDRPARRTSVSSYNKTARRTPVARVGQLPPPETRSLSAAAKNAKVPRSEFIDVDEIKPGMKGYGLTVFQGTKIEKFDVDVIDILKRDYFGRDLILIRTHGPVFDQRKAMVIGGMSGSPIYIGGRLAGAYSMGYPSQNEPVAMVTPIKYMLEAWSDKLPQKPLYTSTSGLVSTPSSTLTSLFGDAFSNPVAADLAAGMGLSAKPAGFSATPMTISTSGLSPHVLQLLNQKVGPMGYQFEQVAGGGKSVMADKAPPFQPGSAFGFAMATGDVEMTNGGTVTYRRGNRVLTLGHPAMGAGGLGPIEVPMTNAYVAGILSSSVRSTKLMSDGSTVGSLVQDTPYSTAGVVGRMPHMIDVTVNVKNRVTGQSHSLHSQVLKHPLMTSNIIESVADEAIYRMHTFPGDVMAKVKTRIVPVGLEPIVRTNTYYSPMFIDVFAIQDLDNLLQILTGNEFGPVDMKSITMDVDIFPGRQSLRIERAFVDRDKVEPGETVQVGVVLRPWRKEPYVKTISVKVPENAPDGRTQIVITNGATPVTMSAPTAPPPGAIATASAPIGPPPPAGPMYRNVQQMIDRYLELEQNTDLVVRLFLTSPGVNILGERLYDVPTPVADVLRSPKSSGYRPERNSVKQVVNMDSYIIGGAVIPITIQKNNYQEQGTTTARPAPKAPPTSTTTTTSTASVPQTPASVETGSEEDNTGDDTATPMSPAPLHLMSHTFRGMPLSILTGDDSPSLLRQRAAKNDKKAEKPSGTATVAPSGDKADGDKPGADDAKPGDAAKPDDKKDDSKDADASKGPGRTAVLWTQKTKAQFERGDGKGVGVTTLGDVRLAPALRRVNLVEQESQVWSLASDGHGGFFLGTGNMGRIYHQDSSGKLGPALDTKELTISSLVTASDGTVYAAGWPTGTIYKLNGDAKPSLFAKTDLKYVMAMVTDKSGNLYVAGGTPGQVVKIGSDGSVHSFFKTTQPHVLSMAMDKDGNLIVGTSDSGALYRVTPDGKDTVLYDPSDNAVTSLLVTKSGEIYAGTAPKGRLLNIKPGGTTHALYEAGAAIMSLAEDDAGNIYAGAGTDVLRVDKNEVVTSLDNDDQNQILSLKWVDGSGLWAASGNLAAVYHADAQKQSGEYLSAVHDSQNPSRWGRVSWLSRTPTGAGITVATRTGNTTDPDTSWSDWSKVYSDSNGSMISSPPGRYIQYRATLSADKSGVSPELKSVTVSYLPENRPPAVSITAPAVADLWSGKQTVRWSGADPDKDTLTYDVYYSNDGGQTWTAIKGGKTETKTTPAKPGDKAAPAPAAPDTTEARKRTPEDVMNQLTTELDKDKTLTPEDRALIDALLPSVVQDAVAQAPDREIKPDPAPAGAPPAPTDKPLSETSYTWDTTKVPDGEYFVKVVASDKRSNPNDALDGDKVLGPITIVNSKPKVALEEKGASVKDRIVTVNGQADGGKMPVSTVSYRVDKGEWAAAAASDGLFDSPSEGFHVVTDALTPGEHTIEVRVTTTGNLNTSKEMKITVK